MPYVKSIPIHSTVNRSIAYILNPEKTEDMVYTTALNCMANAKDAYNDMKMVYEYFSGKKYNAPPPIDGKGSVKAIHYIQSFDPNENITPEQAHRIAKAFARKTFGDDCQIIIATHLDKGHLHNHFILNSYSVSGKKFYDNQTTLKRVREYSDRVCLAFDIQPIKENRGQRKRDSNAPYSPANDMDIYKLSAQLTIINRDNIHSIGELEGKIENLKAEYEKARKELNQLTAKQDSMDSLIEQAERYFELADKPQLTLSEKLKLNICRQAINGSNIQSRADLERIKSVKQETDIKIAVLKTNFENCKQLYEMYANIADTYYEISNGDYISRLVAEERQNHERNEHQNGKNKSI